MSSFTQLSHCRSQPVRTSRLAGCCSGFEYRCASVCTLLATITHVASYLLPYTYAYLYILIYMYLMQ